MKRVEIHAELVEQQTPHACGMRYANAVRELALNVAEERQQIGMERLGFNFPALHAHGVSAPLQVERSHIHLRFADTPAGMVSNLELDAHPLRPRRGAAFAWADAGSKFLPNGRSLRVRYLRFLPARHCFDTQLSAWVGNAEVAPDSLIHYQAQRPKIIAGCVLRHGLNLIRATCAIFQVLLTMGIGKLRREKDATRAQEHADDIPSAKVSFPCQRRIGAVLPQPRFNPSVEGGLSRRVRQHPFFGLLLNEHPVRGAFAIATVGPLLGGLPANAGCRAVFDVQKRASRNGQQARHDSLRVSHICARRVKFHNLSRRNVAHESV